MRAAPPSLPLNVVPVWSRCGLGPVAQPGGARASVDRETRRVVRSAGGVIHTDANLPRWPTAGPFGDLSGRGPPLLEGVSSARVERRGRHSCRVVSYVAELRRVPIEPRKFGSTPVEGCVSGVWLEHGSPPPEGSFLPRRPSNRRAPA